MYSIGQDYPAYFTVGLTDKAPSKHSISKPEEFLSDRAIQRRIRQNISVETSDLPVASDYINQIKNTGAQVINKSKWLNSVTLLLSNADQLETIKAMSFVLQTEPVKWNTLQLSATNNKNDTNLAPVSDNYDQIIQVGGEALHENGFLGENIWIAVFDGGFKEANKFTSLTHLYETDRILGTRNFVSENTSVYNDSYHGTQVLSVLAGEIDGTSFGSAPEASYFLFQTEDTNSESPLEVENWIAALEYADSLGVDVVNSSLGYYEFDDPTYDYSKLLFNGETLRISKAATLGTQKGMVVVNSIGNEGNKDWNYLVAPADSPEVISVGGVTAQGETSSFSSPGPNQNNRVKPDVMALATSTTMEVYPNQIGTKNGTSFSTPIISGLVACLLESRDRLTPAEVVELLHSSSSLYLNPTDEEGYGIPDFSKMLLETDTETYREEQPTYQLYPNPCQSYIKLSIRNKSLGVSPYELFDVLGSKIMNGKIVNESSKTLNVNSLKKGIYFIRIDCGGVKKTLKFIKQ